MRICPLLWKSSKEHGWRGVYVTRARSNTLAHHGAANRADLERTCSRFPSYRGGRGPYGGAVSGRNGRRAASASSRWSGVALLPTEKNQNPRRRTRNPAAAGAEPEPPKLSPPDVAK